MSDNIMVLAHRVPYPPNKGEKLRTYHQLRYLLSKGCRITVCTPLNDEADELDLNALREELGVTTIGRRNRCRYLKLLGGAVTLKPLSISNFYVTELQNDIDYQLTHQPVDVVLCTSSCMAEYVFASKALVESNENKPRLIMDFMDLDSDKWRQYTEIRGLPRSLIYAREARLLRSYECRIHDAFDECVFVSTQEVAMLEKNLGCTSTKLHAIGNGIDPQRFYPADSPPPMGTVHLLFVGVMDYFPNEDAMQWFIKDMWPDVRDRWPNAKISIVGMRPSATIKALSTVEGVEVIGYVDDILPWFHCATIFIAPFRVARGVQNKILQALATGLPVITTSLGAEGISARPEIMLKVANDKEQFVKCVDQIIRSPEIAAELREQALKFVETKCSWGAKNDLLFRLLRKSTF